MQTQTLKASPSTHPSHRRAAGFGFVAAIHVALIYALINMGIITVPFMPPKKHIVFIPLPPPTTPTTIPPSQTPGQVVVEIPPISEPQWNTESPPIPGNGFNLGPTQSGGVTTAATGVMSTHTIPPYPPLSVRLGEVGVVSLHVNISESGMVTEAVIIRSSGHTRLDDAAVAWVKAHWRYRPAMQAGQPVPSAANAQVKFELH